MQEIEIGRAKRGRRAYSFDDVAIVPSRRTRDPEEVSVAWQIDAYRFELPILAAPMDSVMSPQSAVAFGQHGGLGVLDLEGLWTRYDDPSELLAEVAALQGAQATQRLQEIYAEPIKPELITARLREMRESGVTVAGSLSPQRTKEYFKTVVDAGVDMFVIRGTTVSAEHVSGQAEPLNLKEFIYELDVPVISSGLIGSAYSSCSRCVAWAPCSPATSASRSDGSSYRVQSPSRSSTPRPPCLPNATAVCGDITESIGAARIGSSNR